MTRSPDSLLCSSRNFGFALHVLLFAFDLDALAFDVEPQPVEDRHVLIRHPDQSKESEQVSAPIRENQFVARDDKEECRDPMAEAVFARKQIKELAHQHMPRLLATARAKFSRFAKNLFVSDRPANARDRQRDQQQFDDLDAKFTGGHGSKEAEITSSVVFARLAVRRRTRCRATFTLVFLYYITDRKQLCANEGDARRLLLERVRMAATAGVDAIQIRERDLSTRELTELGRRAVEIVRKASPSAKLLINSRSDVAIACGADGVHLRSDNISAAEARAIFMHAGMLRPIIGVSCHSRAEVELAEGHGADFAVFGPIFEKDRELKEEGLASLQSVCHCRAAKASMPVLALGGVNLENAQECLQAGAAGIAGIRLFQNRNVEQVISQLRKLAA